MTCIVGIVEDGKVLIGGDSIASDGWNLMDRADAKVFKTGAFVMGFTTSYRMGQLLRYAFKPPKRHVDQDIMAFMVTDFIIAVRDCLKSGGYAKKDKDAEQGGTFLVGYEGRLFRIEEDYQVGESSDSYAACGCGQPFAMGALYATEGRSASERIDIALRAAEKNSSGVRGPFLTVST